MPSPETVIVVDRDGREFEVPVSSVQGAIDAGMTPQTEEGRLGSLSSQAHAESSGGVRGAVGSFATGALSAATLGGSDVLIGAVGGEDARRELRRLRDVNPIASTAGTIAGSVLPVIPGLGSTSLIKASPVGLANRAGQKIAAIGEGAGAAKKAGLVAAGAATEGALQNLGQYASQVALGDRELSADGFIGAMGNGALYGGVAGGALAIAGSGLTAARRLFPKQEVTREAVEQLEGNAVRELTGAVDDTKEIERAARNRLRQIREEAALNDLTTKLELDKIAVQKARELAESQTRLVSAKADAAVARAQRAIAGPAKRTRKAFGGDPADVTITETTPAPTPAQSMADEIVNPPEPALAQPESGQVVDDLSAPRGRISLEDLESDPWGTPPPLKKRTPAETAPPADATEQPPKFGEALSDEEFQAHKAQGFGRLGDDLFGAGMHYSKYGDESMNGALRTGKELAGDDARAARAFDEAFKRPEAALTRDTTLYRGVRGAFAKENYTNLRPGDVIEDAGYLSTAASANSKVRNEDFVFEIDAPRGTPALAIASKYSGEGELLLPRGTRMRVVSNELTPQVPTASRWEGAVSHEVLPDKSVRIVTEYTNPFTKQKKLDEGVYPPIRLIRVRLVDEASQAAGRSLDEQLMATKAGLDSGRSLAELSGSKRETFVEDALNAHIASKSPEAQKILAGLNDLTESRDLMAKWLDQHPQGKVKAFEYAEGMRKPSGYVRTVPAGEGDIRLPRGRSYEFRGTEAERAAADAKTIGKLTAEGMADADAAVADMASRWSAKTTAKEIIEATDEDLLAKGTSTLDDKIGKVLSGKVDDFAGDLEDATLTVGRLERAIADMSDELGINAPPRAAARAKGYRDAQQAQTAATQQQLGDAIADADKAAATISLGSPPGRAGSVGLASKAADAGAYLEALQMLGVGVPDVRDIPLVGPLLDIYLKARLATKVFRRMPGKIGETAETVIAGKKAATVQRVYTAIDTALDAGAKAFTAAAPKVGGVSAVLGHKLFDDSEPQKRTPKQQKQPKRDDLQQVFMARSDELDRAMQPGAIRDAIRSRIRVSDPTILAAIVAAEERKLQFLDSKRPRAATPGGMLLKSEFIPGRVRLNTWSRYISAANDPASVIESAAAGHPVTPEGAETLRTVYPTLFDAARRRLLERLGDVNSTLPLARRVALSTLFDLPLDISMDPAYGAFLQAGYQAPPAPQQAQPVMGQPTINSDVALGQRTDPMSGAI